VETKRANQFPFLVLRNSASRCREELPAHAALPGRDIPFAVSHFGQGAIHEEPEKQSVSIHLKAVEWIYGWDSIHCDGVSEILPVEVSFVQLTQSSSKERQSEADNQRLA